MSVAVVEHNEQMLCIRRLNTSCIADITSNMKTWFISTLFFGGLYLLSLAFKNLLMRTGSNSLNPFFTLNDFLLLVLLSGLAIMLGNKINLDLLHSQSFCFDLQKNAFSTNGRYICRLNKIAIHLQDGFGSSRRAFRLVVTEGDDVHVIAQTQRYTNATFFGKEYPFIAVTEGRQPKYRYHQWADYTGAKTGFSPNWPEYQELFALHTELENFVKGA